MVLNVLEKQLSERIQERIRDVTPGVAIRAYHGGKQVLDLAVGDTYPYYDLASVTKIIFAVQASMLAFERGKWNMETRVSDVLPWYPHREMLISQLLTHSSGLEGWKALYKEIDLQRRREDRRDQLKQLLGAAPVGDTSKSVYSDLGIMLLGFALESFYDKPLIEIWHEIKEEFYDGTTLEFHVDNKAPQKASFYAPTEECPWRRRLIQGEVHDENTWALGGVSTHAGLFGSVDDVGWYLLNLRAHILGIGRSAIRMKTAKIFITRARQEGAGDWAMGFMLPTPGAASCGAHFNLSAVGHTGFTGTSAWYDPKMDLAVAVLSNRVLYGRENNYFKDLRPLIHDWIVEGLRKSSY